MHHFKKSAKNKLANHILKQGKKQVSEKIIKKSFISNQKNKKKNHIEIMKVSILNTTPSFRLIKLKNKKRRKKSIKEIPTFLSHNLFRMSWSIKHLIAISKEKSNKNLFFEKLNEEILLNALLKGTTTDLTHEMHKKTVKLKKSFRFYRW